MDGGKSGDQDKKHVERTDDSSLPQLTPEQAERFARTRARNQPMPEEEADAHVNSRDFTHEEQMNIEQYEQTVGQTEQEMLAYYEEVNTEREREERAFVNGVVAQSGNNQLPAALVDGVLAPQGNAVMAPQADMVAEQRAEQTREQRMAVARQQANDAERVAEELRREAREERKAKEATKENEGKHRRKDH